MIGLCFFWSFVEFCRVFGKFQKPPSDIEGLPGYSCL